MNEIRNNLKCIVCLDKNASNVVWQTDVWNSDTRKSEIVAGGIWGLLENNQTNWSW